MPSFCVVNNCCDKYGHAESISFHKFPFKRKDLLQKWIDFAQRDVDWRPNKWSSICSQHFTPLDFNCVNARKTLKKTAVPTVRFSATSSNTNASTVTATTAAVVAATSYDAWQEKQPTAQQQVDQVTAQQHVENCEKQQHLSQSTPLINASPKSPKSNCRLCGLCSSAAVTFASNFEIYGMIQKCFPTLNIQQDDNLPKDMCAACLQRLHGFSEFIDKVLETQRELQHKYRQERLQQQPRSLKIKQEPATASSASAVVKVKQEIAEGFDSFLSDELDMAYGMDECGEQEPDASSVDQKFGFCDFPMLNTQDIINNCDIMEIINLDDAFIDIADDDTVAAAAAAAATAVASVAATANAVKITRHMVSAHQLLQTHLLIDEHNYACPAEDLKEEWQIKQLCKTEKTELYEAEQDEALLACGEYTEQHVDDAGVGLEQAAYVAANEMQRSSKPIVTSVSAIAESRLQLAPPPFANTSAAEPLRVEQKLAPKEGTTSNKPNIVVLNESIVKSTTAFQLHACAVCQLKFFSIESLQQHINNAHMCVSNSSSNILPPMVSVPCATPQSAVGVVADTLGAARHKDSLNSEVQQLRNLHSWQQNMKTLQLNALINTWTHARDAATETNAAQQPAATSQCSDLDKQDVAAVSKEQTVAAVDTNVFKTPQLPRATRVKAANNHNDNYGKHNDNYNNDNNKSNNDSNKHNDNNKYYNESNKHDYDGNKHNTDSNKHNNDSNKHNNANNKYNNDSNKHNNDNIKHNDYKYNNDNNKYNNVNNNKYNNYSNKHSNDNNKYNNDSNKPNNGSNKHINDQHNNDYIKNNTCDNNKKHIDGFKHKNNDSKHIELHKHNYASNNNHNSDHNSMPNIHKNIPKISVAAASTTTTKVNYAASNTTTKVNYAADLKCLQRRYRLLLLKCQTMRNDGSVRQRQAALDCNSCSRRFANIYQLLLHKQRAHRRATKLRTCYTASCQGCEKYFLSKRALTNHMRYICQSLSLRWLKTQLQTFRCRVCRSISFTHWRLYRNHELSCRRKLTATQKPPTRQPIKCTHCTQAFASSRAYEAHYARQHNVTQPPMTRTSARDSWRLLCTQCHHSFRQISSLLRHHAKGSCQLEKAPTTSSGATQANCSVICCQCQQYFQQFHKLLTHRNCQRQKQPRSNKRSDAIATTINNINNNSPVLSNATGVYVCSICEKSFGSANSLRQHRITHTQEKRHKCGLCARVFKRRGGLTQHMKGFHLQLKPYECGVCRHRYALKCDMQRCRHSTMLQKPSVGSAVAAIGACADGGGGADVG